jgi:DNA-3-methyladenine glycosylase
MANQSPGQSTKLTRDFFERTDVPQIARDLIGCYLVTAFQGKLTKGRIVETEAYAHQNDRACHAHGGTRTDRTEIMYQRGGHAYVYLCYGIHHLFNIVTHQKEYADAVLIRAVEPIHGLETMQNRRNMDHTKPALTAGPGRLSQALGIHRDHYGLDLCDNESPIWIEKSVATQPPDISTGPRIGVDYAGDDALRPWRFGWKNHPFLSKPFA